MNLFSGLTGRQAMTLCHRCGLQLSAQEPRSMIDDKIYHLYCKWKLEQQAVRNINASKGETYADTLPERSGGDTSIPQRGDASSTSNPQGDVQSHPIPLHWTSHQ